MKTCHFKRKRFVAITYSEACRLIQTIKNRGGRIIFRHKIESDALGMNAFLEEGQRFLYITTRFNGKIATYVFDLATGSKEEASRKCSKGMRAYMALKKYLGEGNRFLHCIVKPTDFNEDGKNTKPFATSPFLYYNEKYNNGEHFAYGYDMNSAYAYAMLGDIPDTRGIKTVNLFYYNKGIVADDEIGFDSSGELVPTGEYALFRFKRVPSPFKPFVDHFYTLKKNALTKAQRKEAKDMLNLAVGYFQRTNPFIRATIVSRANNIIRSLMDENTIHCNTDSIVSLVERKDLPLGDGLGQWKIEHVGMFKYKEMVYQWGNDVPTYRGVTKKWFPENYNILTDPLPVPSNDFIYDYENDKIVRRK